MKILYDYRAFQIFYPRGVSRYIHELFSESIRRSEDMGYVLLDKSKIMPEFDRDIRDRIIGYKLEDFENLRVEELFDAFVNGSACWLGTEGYRSVELLYPPCVIMRCRLVTAILYDFVPLLYRHYIPDRRTEINYALQLEMIRYLDHVFTISEFVSLSGAKYLGRGPEDFTCLYGGANEKRFETAASRRSYRAAERTEDLVYVSGACVRKNFTGAARAFCMAYRSGRIPEEARLLIVCASSEGFESAIREVTETCGCAYGKQVVVTGYVSDARLKHYLGEARASIFPSFYEGLGLPILESYAAGTPCFASSVSSTREFVLGEASFDPFNEDAFVDMIVRIYRDEDLCRRSLEYGRRLLKAVNWKNAAEIMLNKLEELTEGGADR